MASRDFRRAQQRKGETVSEAIEKRHSTHPLIYVGTVIVLVIVVFAFVLAGPGGPMSRGGAGGSGTIIFGSYQGKDIAYYQGSYFAQERDRIANQLRNTTSQDTLQTAQAVWYQAFISTAEHVAILTQAEQAGVRISEDAVDKALLGYPGYLDDNGRFSETRYSATSTADREATRKLTRENLMSTVFVSDIVNGVKSGAKESDFIKNMVKPERTFSFVSWSFSSFPTEEVRKYAEANKSKFQKIKVSRILVKTSESQATEIRKKIVDKISTFEELARTYSKDGYADKGGDMGWRYAYDLEADFETKDVAQKVLSLKAGELSDVLKGTFGWMIYRCDSEATQPDFSDPSVLDDVKGYITKYEKGKIEDYFNGRAAQVEPAGCGGRFRPGRAGGGTEAGPDGGIPVESRKRVLLRPASRRTGHRHADERDLQRGLLLSRFLPREGPGVGAHRAGRPGARSEAHRGKAAPRHHGEPPGQLDRLCGQPVRPNRSRRGSHDAGQAQGQLRRCVQPVRDAQQHEAVGDRCRESNLSFFRRTTGPRSAGKASHCIRRKIQENTRAEGRAFFLPFPAASFLSPPWVSDTAWRSCSRSFPPIARCCAWRRTRKS